MPVTRGKGKVVPRQASWLQEQPATLPIGKEFTGVPGRYQHSSRYTSSDDSCSAQAQTHHMATPQQTSPATSSSPRADRSAAKNAAVGPHRPDSQHTHAASRSVAVTAGPARSDQSWRCAAYLEGGKPTELFTSQIASASCSQTFRKHMPVVIRNSHIITCRLADSAAAAETKTAGRAEKVIKNAASPDYQQQQQQSAPLDILCSPSTTNRFIQADRSKNLPGSYYHVRKPETSQLQMSFTDWLGSWCSWDNNRLLLQALVCRWELKPNSSGARIWPNTAVWPHLDKLLCMTPTLTAQQSGTQSSSSSSAAAAAAGRSPIDWCQLREVLTAGQYSTTGRLYLLAGGRDALLPARYHTTDRLICQVAGRQRLLLLPPDLAFKGLYPYPVAHPYDGYSCVDWEEPELEHWPAAAKVQGSLCDLSPGDSLLVPAYWFVHSQLQQPACVALVLELQPSPSKLLSCGSLLLQLSRMVECWLGAEAGVPNVRKWIMALAEGREWQQLGAQISSVKGYKMIRICEMIMKHLQQVIALDWRAPCQVFKHMNDTAAAPGDQQVLHHDDDGDCRDNVIAASTLERTARQFLQTMCDERLMPTHWLNEGITDPLYLKYPPKQYVIHEDAEAVKYPSLLRHKLIGERADWIQHAQLLEAGSKQRMLTADGSQA